MPNRKEPCAVCGNFAYELHDGFFYCTECGTQDARAQETEYREARKEDGVSTYKGQKKKTEMVAKGPDQQMPKQWYKWHRLNFILFNTADELINFGLAKPSFKKKLLWVWTKYMKVHIKKSHLGLSEQSDEEEDKPATDKSSEDSDDSVVGVKYSALERTRFNQVTNFSQSLVLAIIYIALNIDRNQLQLSKLVRLSNESHISYPNRVKDILPKELSNIRDLYVYKISHIEVGRSAMILFRKLNLGCPVLPDLKLIVEDHIQELCLPNDFKDFVFALMDYYPCNFLDIVVNETYLVKVPNYEAHCMVYIIWGLKLLFGLDCDYELKLSEVVDKINDREKHPKAYFGNPPDSTQRLFSFREWCAYIQFRNVMLKKHCRYFNLKNSLDIDQYIGMEHQQEFKGQPKNFIEELGAEIVNKIPGGELPVGIVPLNEFGPCTTPYSTYTRVIADHIQDPDVKLALTEDFTKYSMKYLTEDFFLADPDDSMRKNIVKGISDENKEVKNKDFAPVSRIFSKQMVYVKDCDNHNWTQTQPPTLDHLFKVDTFTDEPVTDLSQTKIYTENGSFVLDSSDVSMVSKSLHNEELDKLKEENNRENAYERELKVKEEHDNTITEEDEGVNIFDDDFIDLYKTKTEIPDEDLDLHKSSNFDLDKTSGLDMIHQFSLNDNAIQSILPPDRKSLSSNSSIDSIDFNPETFDREKTIKELVLMKCKKHRVPIPRKYNPRVFIRYDAQIPKNRTRRTPRGRKMRKNYIKTLLKDYYSHVENDLLQQIVNSVNKAIQDAEQTKENINDAEEPITEAIEVPPENTIASERADSTLRMEIDETKLEEKTKNGSSSESEALFDEDSDVEMFGAEFLPKKNPKFDEDKYDKKQLYLKVTEPEVPQMEIDSLTTIVEEKIENDTKDPTLLEWTKVKNRSPEDSEDEIPLAEVKQQYEIYKKVFNQKSAPKQPFFRTKTPKMYKYWTTNYVYWGCSNKNNLSGMRRRKTMLAELKKYFPKCFSFVLETCSDMLEIDPFTLYKGMQNCEEYMLIKCKIRSKTRRTNNRLILNL